MSNYHLGHSDTEHERLIRQARRLAPVTKRFFVEPASGPGKPFWISAPASATWQ